MNFNNFETLLIHAGKEGNNSAHSCATPIHQSSAFLFDSSDHAAALFQLKEPGHIYTRLSNPTTEVLEKRIAALEQCSAALAVSSGQASQFIAIQNLAGTGDNIISSSSLYGGTYNQFRNSFNRLGVEIRFTQKNTYKELEQLIDNRTKAIFLETIGNSDFYIPDFELLAEIGERHNLPLIVDNTFGAAGYLFKPAEWGAAVITHAASKWIGGHGTSIGGIVAESGKFQWDNGKFPGITEPTPSYNGLSFWESFKGDDNAPGTAFITKARAEGLRDWGCCLSPFNAFLFLQGLETLALRMERINSNAIQIAEWLEAHPAIEKVNYPGLRNNPNHKNAQKYFKRGFGGVLSFSLNTTRSKSEEFVNSLQLISHLVNVGDNKTLISHFASTTHSQLSDKALRDAGIGPNTLRISLGIEHVEDIKRDISQSLEKNNIR